jgi:hypothetical protein
MEIPLLRLLDTERDGGGVAVEVLGAGEIKDLKAAGLERADARELGAVVAARQSPSLAAFRVRPGAAGANRSLTVDVARYAQQAVLTAAIQEARYRVLMSQDGKTLVLSRFAVRNNQKNFVKIVLPQGATVWSASLAGTPVRPGQASDGSLLLPLAKAAAGEDAPAFAIEIMYLTRESAWTDKGRATLNLPAVDLPVSRTGVELYYPPMFKVTAEPGVFRTEELEPPSSLALTAAAPAAGERALALNSPLNAAQQMELSQAQVAANAFVDKVRAKSQGRRSAEPVLISAPFPAVGPLMFLAAELTGENQGPRIEMSYVRERKGGAR